MSGFKPNDFMILKILLPLTNRTCATPCESRRMIPLLIKKGKKKKKNLELVNENNKLISSFSYNHNISDVCTV